jgi:lactoylglutathione lyase
MKMLSMRGVFEIAIRVKDLPRSEAFYCQVLGLKPGLRDERRNWHFLWVGDSAGMVVLQEDPGEWPVQHFAFRVDEAELERAAQVLEDHDVAAHGPVYHEWMQAKSIYFTDPDGHDLELCAPGVQPD